MEDSGTEESEFSAEESDGQSSSINSSNQSELSDQGTTMEEMER